MAGRGWRSTEARIDGRVRALQVKPLTCVPHHRDRANPKDIGTNDAMGEFSLTAIDALSSMAVMAASDDVEAHRFWETVEELARIYWWVLRCCVGRGTTDVDRYNSPKDRASDRKNASSAWGRFQGRHRNTRGFDIDAKVQVFETTIRGLGGLLSAHLFAAGSLPGLSGEGRGMPGTAFVYNNELLHLAEDLGRRLLPALTKSPTGIPYPRINLRHGLPHGVKNPRYYNRVLGCPQYQSDPESGPEHSSERFWRHPHPKSVKRERPDEETTETCTAGAGSLVLEFTTLSRLTGDPRFEEAAKKAFDAIWSRRSAIGLVGAGVDAESGLWTGANSGIGAGVDSFFEYAFKSYVLLAGNPDEGHFLEVWEKARAALERHVLVREPATWWNNVHVNTGVGIQGGAWIDSLGGFFAGTLSQAGGASAEDDALDLAVRGNLVYSALWNRYNALPERFNTRLSTIEGGLSWYPGRPEFVESTYLLYRATKDPFWLHTGEMAMRDLKRRCWARCGWAGLQDVRTGERQNRMESFWLSETWKYLFLLFDEGMLVPVLLQRVWLTLQRILCTHWMRRGFSLRKGIRSSSLVHPEQLPPLRHLPRERVVLRRLRPAFSPPLHRVQTYSTLRTSPNCTSRRFPTRPYPLPIQAIFTSHLPTRPSIRTLFHCI